MSSGTTFAERVTGEKSKTVDEVLVGTGLFEFDPKYLDIEQKQLTVTEEGGKKLFRNEYDYQEAAKVISAAIEYGQTVVPLLAAKTVGIDVSEQLETAKGKFAGGARLGGVTSVDDYVALLQTRITEQVVGRTRG